MCVYLIAVYVVYCMSSVLFPSERKQRVCTRTVQQYEQGLDVRVIGQSVRALR